MHSAEETSPPSAQEGKYLPPQLGAFDIASASNTELANMFCTSPIIYECGRSKVVKISEDLAIKGGGCTTRGEAQAQKLAKDLGFRVPTVHRVFSHIFPDYGYQDEECWLVVMDFVPGETLEKLWPTLEQDAQKSIVKQVAHLIQELQSTPLCQSDVGPVDGSDGEPWHGPFFTHYHYGTGPFQTLSDMKDWYNHKLDVCIRLGDLPKNEPQFHFDAVALTHQDIAPRNIIIEKGTGQLVLIDWGMAGIYPVGLEPATLSQQGAGEWDVKFTAAVVEHLPPGYDQLFKQLGRIMYGLTTGAFL
jgi:serine/threonine protein kinase